MYPDPDNKPREQRAIRRAPVSGDVVPSRPRPSGVPREIDEGPSDEDIARLDNPVRRCRECGKDVFDDAAICYHCGYAFAAGPKGPSLLQIATVVAIVMGFVALAVWRLF